MIMKCQDTVMADTVTVKEEVEEVQEGADHWEEVEGLDA